MTATRADADARTLLRGDRWATAEEQAAQDAFAERSYETIVAAGKDGRDIPAAPAVDATGSGIEVLRTWVHAETGVGLEALSMLDAVAYRDTDEDWPVEDGYGVLVARHAAGLPVELAAPVGRIEWGASAVRVTTPRGTIETRAVVVTVSPNVLAGGSVRFDPPLPDWKLEAAAAVPLGSANKVAFAIEGRYLGVEEPTNVIVPMADGRGLSIRLRPFGRDLVDAYLARPRWRAVESAGEGAMIEAVRNALVGVLGTDVKRHIAAVASSRWGAEPSILGAYSAAKAGRFHRRADLARSLEDRLFFAGEATSPEFFSTCHGAHLTGIAAVEAAAKGMSRVAVA